MLWTDELDVVAGNNYFDKIAAEIQKWALYLQHLFIKKHILKCEVTMNNYLISRRWIFFSLAVVVLKDTAYLWIWTSCPGLEFSFYVT
jgi:deoxyadenosine/deoxycytidine kinase